MALQNIKDMTENICPQKKPTKRKNR